MFIKSANNTWPIFIKKISFQKNQMNIESKMILVSMQSNDYFFNGHRRYMRSWANSTFDVSDDYLKFEVFKIELKYCLRFFSFGAYYYDVRDVLNNTIDAIKDYIFQVVYELLWVCIHSISRNYHYNKNHGSTKINECLFTITFLLSLHSF